MRSGTMAPIFCAAALALTGGLTACSGERPAQGNCGERVCGQVDGLDCGFCAGATEYCSDQGQCVEACVGRQCGLGEAGVECGVCAGATERCDELGQWVLEPGYEDHPVDWVTIGGAYLACEHWGGHLCKVGEWERACGGPEGLAFPYGDEYDCKSDAPEDLDWLSPYDADWHTGFRCCFYLD